VFVVLCFFLAGKPQDMRGGVLVVFYGVSAFFLMMMGGGLQENR